MKKGLIVVSLVGILGSFAPTSLLAADGQTSTQSVTMTVNGSSLIRVDGGAVSLSLSGATTAGAAVTAVSQDSITRLSISSLTVGAATNKISAAVTGSPTMDYSNTQLFLRLLPPTGLNADHFINLGSGGGTFSFGNDFLTRGDSYPGAELKGNTAIDLVTGIGTCWSGTAVNDGYIIQYIYKTTGTGTPQNRAITITFTISAS